MSDIQIYFIFLGAPGAGKGTQADYLAQELGLTHVSTGDLFREAWKNGTPVGLEAYNYIEKGELVPDEISIPMLLEYLESPACNKGAILDGFPRTIDQAIAFDKALTDMQRQVDSVLCIDVSEKELVRRLSGRWICMNCQFPYHVDSRPPVVRGVCDKCGGQLYHRSDDSEETIGNRLSVYLERTAPLVDYYVNSNKLIKINGDRDTMEVRMDILNSVSSLVKVR